VGGNIELPPTEQVSFYGYSTGKVRLELNHAALSCLGTGRIALRVLESIMPSGNPIFIHVTGMVGAANGGCISKWAISSSVLIQKQKLAG